MTITLGPGDLVNFEGANTTVTKLKVRLAEIAKANPMQPLEIARDTSVGPILLKRVEDGCHHTKLVTKVLDPTPAVITPTPTPGEPAAEGSAAKTPPPKALPVTETPKAKPLTETEGPQGQVNVRVYANGSLGFKGSTLTLSEFQVKLNSMLKATPDQSIVLTAGSDVPYDKLQAAIDSCNASGVKNLVISGTASGPAPDKAPAPASPAPKVPPAAESPRTKSVTESAKPSGPLTVQVHVNGSIGFKGASITLAEFQSKLKSLVKTTPEQELVIKSGAKVPYDKLKAVLDSCADAQVRHVTIASPAPAPPPASPSIPESPAANLPAPALLMHPSMETMSSNAPPIAPNSPASSSATNAAPANP